MDGIPGAAVGEGPGVAHGLDIEGSLQESVYAVGLDDEALFPGGEGEERLDAVGEFLTLYYLFDNYCGILLLI